MQSHYENNNVHLATSDSEITSSYEAQDSTEQCYDPEIQQGLENIENTIRELQTQAEQNQEQNAEVDTSNILIDDSDLREIEEKLHSAETRKQCLIDEFKRLQVQCSNKKIEVQASKRNLILLDDCRQNVEIIKNHIEVEVCDEIQGDAKFIKQFIREDKQMASIYIKKIKENSHFLILQLEYVELAECLDKIYQEYIVVDRQVKSIKTEIHLGKIDFEKIRQERRNSAIKEAQLKDALGAILKLF